jgi:predicted glycoside hydrolase/deacetylase ChbG (UPF0249 family)
MIIVNADDWGRSVAETDAALRCHATRRITSVTAMVFMEDSERAAALALEHGLDVGLHLNFSQPFTAAPQCPILTDRQERVCRFINSSKYSFLLYNPALRRDFAGTYQVQLEEFCRLYGKAPSHVDGHHHKHLCSNVLLGDVIPAGQKVRRNFFFWPEEKSKLNRAYRGATDHLLSRKYRLTDYFFALSQCMKGDRLAKVLELAKTHAVEVMTHPANPQERDYLMSERYLEQLDLLERGTYSSL